MLIPRVKLTRLLLCLIIFSYSFCCYAGAWVQEKGHGLNILLLRHYVSTRYWTPAGRQLATPIYTKYEIDDYAEYGVTKKLTLGFYFSAIQSHTADTGIQRGVNDTEILGRYLLYDNGRYVFSAQVFYDKLGRAAQFNIPPQNSGYNTGEAILFGTSGKFGDKAGQYWFFDALLGLVQRYSDGNQLQFNVEGGWKIESKSIWLFVQNYNTFSTGHFSNPQGVEYNLVTVSPSILYWLHPAFALQFGVSQDIYGQNVGKGTAPYLGAWLQF